MKIMKFANTFMTSCKVYCLSIACLFHNLSPIHHGLYYSAVIKRIDINNVLHYLSILDGSRYIITSFKGSYLSAKNNKIIMTIKPGNDNNGIQ